MDSKSLNVSGEFKIELKMAYPKYFGTIAWGLKDYRNC